MIIVHIKYTNNSLSDYWCICFHGISLLTWENNIQKDNRMAHSHAVHCRQRRWFHEKTVSKAADMMAEHMMNGARMDETSAREYLHEKLESDG